MSVEELVEYLGGLPLENTHIVWIWRSTPSVEPGQDLLRDSMRLRKRNLFNRQGEISQRSLGCRVCKGNRMEQDEEIRGGYRQ